MNTGKTTLASLLVVAASLLGVSSSLACEDLATRRVKERAPGVFWGSRELIAIGDFDGDGNDDQAFFLATANTLSLVS